MGMEAPRSQEDAVKVMVVGDSISHGREGDWTWRYRIWQWFREQRVAVRFVGPYQGTVPPDDPHPPRPPRLLGDPPDPPPAIRTNGGYAAGVDHEFLANSAHFALAGRQAYHAKDLVADQVAAHQPDICLVELGFNDLGWRRCGPVHTLASMRHFIDQARSAKPNLRFAIADIPQRTFLPGREDLPVDTDRYNEMLAMSIASWSSAESPIALVRFCENYSCGGSNSDAAYDGLHPNALGEYQLAQAFSRTLVSAFSLGRAPLVIPKHIPPRPLRTPTGFKVVAEPSGVVISWEPVYGAFGYDLQHRRAGEVHWSQIHLDGNRYYRQQLRKGQVVESRVRASGGDNLKSPWTRVASVVADPKTPPPPSNVLTHAESTGFRISWDPPPPPACGYFDRYAVTYFDGDQPGAFPCTVGVKDNEATIPGLIPGHRYFIFVTTWSTVGQGLPAGARPVRVGKGRPRAPSYAATALDWRTVEIIWTAVPDAAGYDLWHRPIQPLRGDRAQDCRPRPLSISKSQIVHDSTANTLKATLYNVHPSVWDWEYAVTAYNGSIQSAIFRWVTPSRVGADTSLTEADNIRINLHYG